MISFPRTTFLTGIMQIRKPLAPRHRLPLPERHFTRHVAACREEIEAADLLFGLHLARGIGLGKSSDGAVL